LVDITGLVSRLGLIAHPEGGYYKRIFASAEHGIFGDVARSRSLCTAIIYLLHGEQFSAFHRIKSDELWQLGEGNTAIRIIEIQQGVMVETLLSREHPVHCVKANTWFAAELAEKHSSAFALAYCTVVPGFDFADFELGGKSQLLLAYPECAKILSRLCIRD
jgi:uncharacterized protein